MNERCPLGWCACGYTIYEGDDPDRCPESIDDERGVARCWLGRGHHVGHSMLWSVMNVMGWSAVASPKDPA